VYAVLPGCCLQTVSYNVSDRLLLFSVLTHLSAYWARFCLMGDLNLPEINWDLFIHPDNGLHNSASDFVCANGLAQLVDQPTCSDNTLDYIFCSETLLRQFTIFTTLS
jgi:hypothetical protein